MKIFIYIIVFALILIDQTSCIIDRNGPDIDIGNYEKNLENWNSQNLLNYQLTIRYDNYLDDNVTEHVIIIVKNGIPESSNPPKWLEKGQISTVLDFFSYIKKEEKRFRGNNSPLTKTGYFEVSYHYNLYYPNNIRAAISTSASNRSPHLRWEISLMPLEEIQTEAMP